MPHVVVANYAPAATADTFSTVWKLTRALKKAGWVYRASGDGTTKDTSADPSSDKWGAPTPTGISGAAGAIGAKAGSDLTLTGLTGMTVNSVGRYLTISGAANSANNGTFQVVGYISASSVKVRNPAGVAGDANAITWVEKDDLLTTYSSVTIGANAWWCAQGPSTLKIPFTAAPTGVFLHGEKVTQTGSGAEGEVIGVTLDPSSGVGFMVVSPQLSGSGGGRKGWNTNTITGASSGASLTPSATPVEFVREIVFFKQNSLTLGSIYYQCVDAVSEASSRFSTLATSAGCTATNAPGVSGTGNTFPIAGSYVVKGNNGSSTGAAWHNTTYTTSGPFGNAQIIAANAIETQGVSADGSIVYAIALTGSAFSSAFSAVGGWSLQRLDNTEEGDVEPYAWFVPGANVAFGSRSRTADSGVFDTADAIWRGGSVSNNGKQSFVTWRRRGFGTGDAFAVALGAIPGYGFNTTPSTVIGTNMWDTDRASSAADFKMTMEPIWLVNYASGTKMRKGTTRWMYLVPKSIAYNLYDEAQWLSLYSTGVTITETAIVVGPWDRTSNPSPWMP